MDGTHKAPGQAHRQGISLVELLHMFPTNEAAELWFTSIRWPEGVRCAHCGSDRVNTRKNRKPMPYHCAACRKYFSVRTNTLMQSSKLNYQKWAIAVYLANTGIKGTSSMKLHRDLRITQKSAWHLAHRIRETWQDAQPPFEGPVEVDESFFGGKRKNMHAKKRRQLKGRGTVGKTPVIGIKDRKTGKISMKVVRNTDKASLQPFIARRVKPGAEVFTDEHKSYTRMGRYRHEAVAHGVGEFVRGKVHTNSVENAWSLLKRAYHGTYHRMSPKHFHRYVTEFEGRYNDRQLDRIEQMESMVRGMIGKRLQYKELVA